MFGLEDKVFSHKNVISKNTQEKTSYLPKAGWKKNSSYLIHLRKVRRIDNWGFLNRLKYGIFTVLNAEVIVIELKREQK
jgi:hypothetical protein